MINLLLTKILLIMEIRKSQRKRAKMKLSLLGSSGSGKTYSSLLIAYGICNDWNKITILDCENNSADLYSHLGDFNVLSLEAPFTPERYIEAIKLCEKSGTEVLIIDTISNEWQYILKMHASLSGNNSFVKWNQVKPLHDRFVQKILSTSMHVICNIRAKEGYMIQQRDGRQYIEKIGLKGITNPQIEYDFTTVLYLDINHNAVASKDRTGIFSELAPFRVTKETGRIIIDWCNRGTSIDEVKDKVAQAKSIDELLEIRSNYPEFRSEINSLLIKRKEALKTKLQPTV